MAALSTVAAIASVVIGGVSYVSAEKSRKQAAAANQQQAEENKKVRSEQAALNAQQAASERRQQIREERVRRARLLAAAENTGTEGSSGALGGVGGFATQLGANIGTNLGQLAGTGRINQYSQQAADFGTASQNAQNRQAASQNLFGLSMSIFNAAGGFGAFKTQTPAPKPAG